MKPKFKSQIRFGDNSFALGMGKVSIVMNKLLYLGQPILDLSKVLMFRFYYKYSLPKYIDTDSFFYCIETLDYYTDIASDVDLWLDTSSYNPADERPLPIGQNKKVVGLMKDSLEKAIITGFVGLRSMLIESLMDPWKSAAKE